MLIEVMKPMVTVKFYSERLDNFPLPYSIVRNYDYEFFDKVYIRNAPFAFKDFVEVTYKSFLEDILSDKKNLDIDRVGLDRENFDFERIFKIKVIDNCCERTFTVNGKEVIYTPS